jgi:hypothetical protein
MVVIVRIVTGYSILDTGFSMLDTGFSILDARYWIKRAQGARFKV